MATATVSGGGWQEVLAHRIILRCAGQDSFNLQVILEIVKECKIPQIRRGT